MSVKKASKLCVISYVLPAVLLLLAAGFCFISSRAKGFASELCEYRSRAVMTGIVTDAAEEALQSCEPGLYVIERSADGSVVSVSADQRAVNTLKNSITAGIERRLDTAEPERVYITLGDLSGSAFLSNKGPAFEVEYTPTAAVSTDIEFRFEEAGVDQTRILTVLNVSADIAAVFPFGKETLSFYTDYILADEVIVGDTPAFYSKK